MHERQLSNETYSRHDSKGRADQLALPLVYAAACTVLAGLSKRNTDLGDARCEDALKMQKPALPDAIGIRPFEEMAPELAKGRRKLGRPKINAS